MLVPGFTVRELPVKITNINDVLYAPDGRLFAAGYDGRIHVLRDTDNDGLEDKVEEFWYQPTVRTPLGMALAPEGLYVVANSKLVLLKDTDNDGRADHEEVVVSDWIKDDGITGGGVDALGIAIDRDNNLYFGLGCANFANPYRMHEGKARYDIKSERGTILRVSPDRKTREVFCTGYRFGINLAFNRHGDLFGTDQEGETWLPNGNPRDELNHIRRGVHYGFPPKHPEHLPNVVDEPPVVSFGPQHQSTCGLTFNEAAPKQKSFGPDFWEGDALVCGFSRGKLWRVPLVKTDRGYVGRETLIAQSSMMLFDAALSPAGDVVVSCHVGPPDWGVGPQGDGKLFKISYTNPKLAQPVITYAASPIEVRVAFDRELPSTADAVLSKLAGAEIEYGDFVRAADRFENLKPPYEVVKQQGQTARGKLPLVSARISDNRRTLILTTNPHPYSTHYAFSLPMSLVDPHAANDTTIELDYTLNGVELAQTPSGSRTAWLPHRELEVALALLRGTSENEQIKQLVSSIPSPSLQYRLASKGDWRRVSGTVPIFAESAEQKWDCPPSNEGASTPNSCALPPTAFLLPWAPGPMPPAETKIEEDPKLAGGDPHHGREIFLGKVAQCADCHAVHGEGAKIGPDLSNLAHRDRASILRDIVTPSAVINPDHVAYTATLLDGRVFTGVLRPDGEKHVRVIDSAAKETLLATADIEELRPAKASIMPEGIDKKLSPSDLRDLLAFLTARREGEAPAEPLRSK
jgi:putative heme-binding domain-containing protein